MKVWGPNTSGFLSLVLFTQFAGRYEVDLILIGMISFVPVVKAILIT